MGQAMTPDLVSVVTTPDLVSSVTNPDLASSVTTPDLVSSVWLKAVVNIRLTAGEKEFLRQEAKEAGLTLSVFGRRRLLGHKVRAQVDLVVVNELRRLGGLLKHLHNQSGMDTSVVLGELRACLQRLAQ
jgi:hypothetical protein